MKKQNQTALEVLKRTRNKEETKARLLNAVGTALATEGYANLTATGVARHAGCDDQTVRRHFGDLANLVDAYVASKNFWPRVFGKVAPLREAPTKEELKAFLRAAYSSLLATLTADREMQQLMLWNMSESAGSLKKLNDPWEKQIDRFVAVSKCGSESELRAFLALLFGGVCTIVLGTNAGFSVFGRLDVTKERDYEELGRTIAFLIDGAATYLL